MGCLYHNNTYRWIVCLSLKQSLWPAEPVEWNPLLGQAWVEVWGKTITPAHGLTLKNVVSFSRGQLRYNSQNDRWQNKTNTNRCLLQPSLMVQLPTLGSQPHDCLFELWSLLSSPNAGTSRHLGRWEEGQHGVQGRDLKEGEAIWEI